MPDTGCRGYKFSHLPALEQIEKRNNHQKQRNEAAKRALNRKKLHEVQKSVGLPKTPIKRQSKPIPKASKKRLAELKIYSVLRKDYLKDYPNCQAKLSVCKRKAVDIHHTALRGKNLNNVDTWLSVCRECHNWIHVNSNLARELGLLKTY